MNRITELREKMGLKQTQLGKMVNAAQNTVSNWEKGNRTPDYETLKLLSKIFDCNIEYMMGDTNNSSPNLNRTIFNTFLSDHEQNIIEAYRSKPEMQPAVDRLLGIEKEEKILSLYSTTQAKIVARNGSNITTDLTEEQIKEFQEIKKQLENN